MKTPIASYAILAFLFLLPAWGEKKALLMEGLTVLPNGSFVLDGDTFTVVHYDNEWHQTNLSAIKQETGSTKRPADKWIVSGTLPIQDKQVPFTGELTQIDGHSLHLQDKMVLPPGISTQTVALVIEMPIDQASGRKIEMDGKPLVLPATLGEAQLASKKATKLVVPSRSGTLTLEGDLSVYVQDERKWKIDSFEIRVALAHDKISQNTDTTATLDAKLTYTPITTTPVPFAGQANMGFVDPIANDGKGGWSDQGPANDLSPLPVGSLQAARVGFNILNAANNGGKAALVFSGPNGEKFLDAVDIPLKGAPSFSNLYFLHAAAWTPAGKTVIGKAEVRFTDGTKSSFDVLSGQDVGDWWGPTSIANGAVGWSAENKSNLVGLYVSRFPIENKPIKEIHLEGNGKAMWMIAGISGSAEAIQFPTTNSSVIIENADWKPFTYSLDIKPGSVFDFSALNANEIPAGKFGAITATPAGHFEFAQRPGVPVRFWGVNLCFDANFPEKADADQLADRLSRSGYNTVRFHHFDGRLLKKGGKSWDLDPAQLDKLDYLFAALKARGIYLNIDLYVDRHFKPDELPDLNAEFDKEMKLLLPVSDAAHDSWEKYSQALLTHVNPYTKLSWAADPALIGICPVNEDSIAKMPNSPPAIKALYEKAFDVWLAKQDSSVKEHPDAAKMRFLTDIYQKSDARMIAFLRKLGVKALITGSNFQNYEMLSYLRENYDYIDNHLYWDHPQFPVKRWTFPYKFNQTSATQSGARAPRNIMPSRILGKPFAVTEFNFVWPDAYRSEGGVLMAAYSSLQDWDAMYNFDYASSDKTLLVPARSGCFNISDDPIGLLADRFSALIFRRSDIKPAPHSVGFVLQDDQVYSKEISSARSYPDSFSLLGLITRIGTVTSAQKVGKTDALVAEAALAKENITDKKPFQIAGDDLLARLTKDGVIPNGCAESTGQHYVSETGELDLQGDAGLMKVVTPRTEAFVLPPDKQLAGAFASVTNGPVFGSVFVTAVDGKPLAQSNRILVLFLTDCLNDKMQFGDYTHRLAENPGDLPHLVQRGTADLALQLNHPKEWKAWQVAPDGTRGPEQALTPDTDHLRLALATVAGDQVCLAYELVRGAQP